MIAQLERGEEVRLSTGLVKAVLLSKHGKEITRFLRETDVGTKVMLTCHDTLNRENYVVIGRVLRKVHPDEANPHGIMLAPDRLVMYSSIVAYQKV